MKKLSSEKVFKATLATAVAAGAFVAVAPVNTEAAPTFSDVRSITSHYDAIMNYTAKDMISGFPDGTFRQGQAITRQDAAKLLALVLELDLVNVKDAGFKDVSKTNPNYKYIAALVEAGIITGYEDNTFKPNDNLSRAQMAKILVLGFELEEAGSTNLPFKDINDRQWHIEFVRTLYANEITTGTTSTTFSPNALVTRGQMVAFVMRSEATAVPRQSEVDQASVTAAASQLTAGAVTVSRGNSATDANKLAAVQTYVTSQITDKEVKATVVASTTAGNYAVTLTKGEAKAEKTIAMTFNNAADDRFVTEVTAINAKQVVVKFATPVTKTSVLNSSNELQNITFTMVSGATVNPGQLKGSLSEDGKTLTITANWIFDGEYAFKSTTAIQSTTGGNFEEHTAIIKASDKVAPKIVSASAAGKVSTNSFSVLFDEPVNATGAIAYVNNIAATVKNNATDPNRLDITVNSPIATGTLATIKLVNVKDYNNNQINPNPAETTITVGSDTTVPTVIDAKVLGENRVEVTYDKEMNIASFAGKARLVHPNGTVVNLTASKGSNEKTVVLTGTGGSYSKNNYDAVLFVDADVKDTVGNSTTLYSKNLTFYRDDIAPSLVSVEYKDGKIIANFTEDVVAGNNTVATVIDPSGVATTVQLNYYSTKNAVIDKQSLIIDRYLPNGNYQLRLPANTVVDKAAIPNSNPIAMQTFIVQNSVSSGQVRPVVAGITNIPAVNGIAPNTDQTATYTVVDVDSGVNLDSVQDLNNYTWDGKALPIGSYVTNKIVGSKERATSVDVTVHVPTSGITETKTEAFTVRNIRNNAGNPMLYTESGLVTFVTSNYNQNYNKPEFTSATIGYDRTPGYNNETLLELGFSEAIQARTLDANDLEITVNNGYYLPASSIVFVDNAYTDREKFNIKIQASVANDVYNNGRWEDIIYLNLDRDQKFDERTDLILDVVDSNVYDARDESRLVTVNLDSRYIKNLKVKLVRHNASPVVNVRGNEAVFDKEIDVRLR